MLRRTVVLLTAAAALVACSDGDDYTQRSDTAIATSTGDDESGSDLNREGGDNPSELDSQIAETLSDLHAEQRGDDAVLTVPEQVLFDFGQYALRPDASQVLDGVVQVIDQFPDAPVQINGHTDSVGSHVANQQLSEQRAQAVMDYLSSAGLDAARLQDQGFGETQPVEPNTNSDGSDNPEGRATNRRVEIILAGVDLADLDSS